jgi:RNA polymerase sigma-70 factor (ECF subfamily)
MGLAGRYGFGPSDREDICQELLLDCFVRLRKYHPAKSSRRTFVHRIVNHRAANLIEARMAARRDYRACQDSLNDRIESGDGEAGERGDSLSGDYYDASMGRSALSSCERAELQIDVARLVASLPTQLATVAVALKWAGAVEVSRRLRISRATLYRRIGEIRDVFTAAGLNGYQRYGGSHSRL